jgi:hypothetical protein|tara:strand:- start:162 stop:404 length:243 start_codon:yes stop_codon:yes gene_type:complete
MVPALELHLLQLLLYFFLHAKELWLFTLHRAHTCLVVKLLKAFVMEPVLARFALYRIDQYGLAKGAKELWFQLIFCQQVL